MKTLLRILAFVVVLFAFVRTARAEPIRIVVAVGHRAGLPGQTALKHSLRDATRMRDLFVQIGDTKPENAILLTEPTAAALYASLERAAAIARTRRPEDVTFLFYFSGHGDRERINLGAERVPLADLDARIAKIPASLRIVVADACRTGEARPKSVTDDEPFAITLGAPTGASGIVRIHASADGEVAQESDELGGAVFTHYFITGLSGAADADNDARVTLAEAYAFAYGQTLFRSARASGVVQRPAVQLDLKEAAPIVLTRTSTASAIGLPRAADVHYLVYGIGSRTVVGELWSSPDRVVALAVAPGKYIVQRRAGGRSAAAQIDVARGEKRVLATADFRAMAEETLAKKGGDLALRPHELSLGYDIATTKLVDVGHELSLRYAYAFDAFALSLGALGGMGSIATDGQSGDLRWLGLEALFELRLVAGDLVFRGGLGPKLLATFQTLERDDAARLGLAGYPATHDSRATQLGGQAVLGARWLLSEVLFVDLVGRGELLAGKRGGETTTLGGAALGAGLGAAF